MNEQGTRRILIVDDSFLMRRVIRNIIERDPSLSVSGEAGDGEAGLAQLVANPPDVVLLDIEMPRMDGVEFLRRAQLVSDARVIVISSVAQLGSPQALEVLDLGAADILPKPSGVLSVDFEEQRGHALLDAIHRCLA